MIKIEGSKLRDMQPSDSSRDEAKTIANGEHFEITRKAAAMSHPQHDRE
jgi:hypothetical protein